MNIPQKPTLLLIVLLVLFSLKGIFLAVLMPLFQNPDELTHYATVQHWATESTTFPFISESKTTVSPTSDDAHREPSPEVIAAARSEQFDEIQASSHNIRHFADSSIRAYESNSTLSTPPLIGNISGTRSIYYLLASHVERVFENESIFTRVFFSRLLSVFIGVGIIIIAYLTARKIGFSDYNSLLIATLLAFQPMLSITAAQINIDIALILAFSLFLYAGASLLRDGFGTRRLFLILGAAVLGLFSKGPGIILLIMIYPLLAWLTYRWLRLPTRQYLIRLIGTTVLLFTLIFFTVPKGFLLDITRISAQSHFHSPLLSLGAYLDKAINIGEFRDTARSYWGHFGWLDHAIADWSLSIIIVITITGFLGTLWYLFSRQHTPYLPERKYLIFLLGMVLALELAIRFYDWRVFDLTGQILIGQPGRYFLPNLIAHLIIIVTGFSFLFRNILRSRLLLQSFVLAMILLQLQAIVNVIIPRYYL